VRVFRSGIELLDSECLPQIDCLITDIDMPGMDGFELLRLVNVDRPGLPTILITGYPDRLNQLSSAAAAHLRSFTKPFQGELLLAAVEDLLRLSRT